MDRTLWPQNLCWRNGFDERARRIGEFPVRSGQRVRLQLGQCDVLGLVGVGPIQLGRYSPSVIQGALDELTKQLAESGRCVPVRVKSWEK
jgi:hypothetical protein|nr:hypothetical protein [Streptomyces sp. DSM 41633]